MNQKVASSRTANNITLLRHFAAFFVLIFHSFDLTGKISDEFLRRISGQTISFSKIGLIIFFFISGFLITQSLVSSSGIKQFISVAGSPFNYRIPKKTYSSFYIYFSFYCICNFC
ncbi:MAG TPA: hypothetical protein VIJ95_12895 [Hanamia sp.]